MNNEHLKQARFEALLATDAAHRMGRPLPLLDSEGFLLSAPPIERENHIGASNAIAELVLDFAGTALFVAAYLGYAYIRSH